MLLMSVGFAASESPFLFFDWNTVVASGTLPGRSKPEPCVREAAAAVEVLSLRRADFVIIASHNRYGAIHADAETFGHQRVVVIRLVGGRCHVFLLVQQR